MQELMGTATPVLKLVDVKTKYSPYLTLVVTATKPPSMLVRVDVMVVFTIVVVVVVVIVVVVVVVVAVVDLFF